MASPQWALPWPESPHLHPRAFPPTALLSHTAAGDDVVPAGPARELHEALRPHYAGTPERLRLVEHPQLGHGLPPVVAARVRAEMAAWFRRFLAAGHPLERADAALPADWASPPRAELAFPGPCVARLAEVDPAHARDEGEPRGSVGRSWGDSRCGGGGTDEFCLLARSTGHE